MTCLNDPTLRSELKAIGRAVLLLFGLGLGVAFLVGLFFWELSLTRRFTESGPIELFQSAALGVSSALFFLEAKRQPAMRGALVLVGGFLGCMFIREQDYFLDFIRHGCWVYPALALAFGCIAYASRGLRQTISGLERFVRWKYFPYLLIGLVIALAYSRLFGMRVLWEMLLGEHFRYVAKCAVEEASELLGYLFILVSAILANTDKHLN